MDFKPKDRVEYCPPGKTNNGKTESGTISSVNGEYAFVKFDATVERLGWSETTAQAVNFSHLKKIL